MYASNDLVLTDRYLGDFTKKKEFVNLLKSYPSRFTGGKVTFSALKKITFTFIRLYTIKIAKWKESSCVSYQSD